VERGPRHVVGRKGLLIERAAAQSLAAAYQLEKGKGMENETLEELLSEFADSVARVAQLREISRDGAGHGYIDYDALSRDLGSANQRCRDARRAIHVYVDCGITDKGRAE